MNQSNGEKEILRIYNELDKFFRTSIGQDEVIDHAAVLQRISRINPEVNRYTYELRSFSKLRNMLVHDSNGANQMPLIEPTEFAVKRYQELADLIMKPKRALNIAVRASHVFTVKLSDHATKVMAEMNRKTFTHAPVIQDGKMIGVFSENTVFAYLVKEKQSLIDEQTTIGDFKDFIGFNDHPSEKFVFVSSNSTAMEIREMFSEAVKNGVRIGMIFVTANGKPKESLLGVITAWDLAKA
ncbi:MAG: CBS domain-containing protein [Candidatus Nomurabacteria bacterium]|nr:MAG: CBS domain-containing protein [Candidatus Nomurabacteria bacterium]HRV75982.1 CBS domain-containing protein [Candidatus Saccharimonadales bacterium]